MVHIVELIISFFIISIGIAGLYFARSPKIPPKFVNACFIAGTLATSVGAIFFVRSVTKDETGPKG